MMQPSKLFRVLVLGGSLLVTNIHCGTGDRTRDTLDPATLPEMVVDAETQNDAESQADAASTVADADAPGDAEGQADADPPQDADTTVADAGEQGSPCFCSPDRCCEVGPGGTPQVQDGFWCCWSTSC